MRKRIIALLIISLISSILSGCSEKGSGKSVIQDNTSSEDNYTSKQKNDVNDGEDDRNDDKQQEIDVDLTVLSSTMVYAEVFNIMLEPESYLKKTIKVRGEYYSYYHEEKQEYYHFIVIADATACCQQGLEFILLGEHQYPDDFPVDGTEIELTGIFKSDVEDELTYYYIETNSFNII